MAIGLRLVQDRINLLNTFVTASETSHRCSISAVSYGTLHVAYMAAEAGGFRLKKADRLITPETKLRHSAERELCGP